MPTRTLAGIGLGSIVVLTLTGCGGSTVPAQTSAVAPPFLETPVAAKPEVSEALIARGRSLYSENCAHCHGETGAGDGFGAPFLVPPPRDLVTAEYKFRTTSSGGLPTDEDLFRIISRGASGTGMPPWQHLLSDEDRWALVEYLKTLSPKFERWPDRPAMAIAEASSAGGDPRRGHDVYARMQCAQCHGEDGRGAGPMALDQRDSKGRFVNTRDLTNPGTFRTGWTAREIVRTLDTGLNGVPMPSYAQAMTDAEKWDLAAYVMSLAAPGSGNQKRTTVRSMEGVGSPDRVIALREHAWRYEPSEIRVKAGEVVRIDVSVTDNGLGAGHGFAIDGYDQEVFINGAMVGAPQSATFRIDRPGRYNFYCSTQCSTTELHPHMSGVIIVE